MVNMGSKETFGYSGMVNRGGRKRRREYPLTVTEAPERDTEPTNVGIKRRIRRTGTRR